MRQIIPFPKNILLDRDGTIIEDCHYLSNPKNIKLLKGVGITLASFYKKKCNIFIVSNQSGIERGYFRKENLFECQKKLYEFLSLYKVNITDFKYCPHIPESKCTCRKPNIGMWLDLKRKYNLYPSSTIMIGDKIEDIMFGVNAGLVASFLVLTGKGKKTINDLDWIIEDKVDYKYILTIKNTKIIVIKKIEILLKLFNMVE